MTLPEKLKQRNLLENDLKKKSKRLARKLKERAHPKTVRDLVDDCGKAFDDLETAHYAWVDYLHADKPDEETAKQYLQSVDSWLKGVEDDYEKLINEASEQLPRADTASDTSMNESISGATPLPQVSPGSFTLDISEAMAEKLIPPSIDCMIFGDNPRDWKLFEAEFDVNVKRHFKCEKQLVSFLLKFTSHKAKAAVKPHVTSGSKSPFSDAWHDLKELFGTPAILARHILNDLKEGPSVVTADELLEFARDIKQAVDQLAHTPHESDIKGHAIIDDLLVRLSSSVHTRWSKAALKHKVAHEQYPDINDFLKFIKLLAAESNDEYYGLEASKRRATKSTIRYKDKKGGKKPDNSSSFSQEIQNAAVVASPQAGSSAGKALPTSCLYCKNERHDLKSCRAFLALEPSRRWDDNLNKSKLCWKCLSVSCKLHAKCKVNNPCSCAMPFHYLLHPTPCSAQSPGGSSNNDNGCVQTVSGYTLLPVLEVVVGKTLTYALQDSGSTASYITQDLVDRLKLHTEPSKNFTRTINGASDTDHRIVNSIKVRGRSQCVFKTIKNVFVCSQVPASTRNVALDLEEYPYLEGLNLEAQRKEGVGLLIGSDSGLNLPLECKKHPETPETSPYAIKYPLGWAIAGSISNASQLNSKVNDCNSLECHFTPAQLNYEKNGKIKSKEVHQSVNCTSVTDEDRHNCKYTTRSPDMPYFAGKGKKLAPQVMSTVSAGSAENVSARLSGRGSGRAMISTRSDVITPDELSTTPGGEYQCKYEVCRYEAPTPPPDLHRRNDRRSCKKAPESSPRHCMLSRGRRHGNTSAWSHARRLRGTSSNHQTTSLRSHSGKKAPEHSTQCSDITTASASRRAVPSSSSHLHVAVDTGSALPKDVTSSPAGDISVSDVMNHTNDVMMEVPIPPPRHMTPTTANAAVRTPSPPDLTDNQHHHHDLKSSMLSACIWFMHVCYLLIKDCLSLCTALWMQKLYSSKPGTRRRLRHYKPSASVNSSICLTSCLSAGHVTPYCNTIKSQLNLCIVLLIICAVLTILAPDTSLQTSVPQDSTVHIQERSLTFSSLSVSMVAMQEHRLTFYSAVLSIMYTQERNLINATFAAKMNIVVATDISAEKLFSIQLAAQKFHRFRLYSSAVYFINFTPYYTGKFYIPRAMLHVPFICICSSAAQRDDLSECKQSHSLDVYNKPVVMYGLMEVKILTRAYQAPSSSNQAGSFKTE